MKKSLLSIGLLAAGLLTAGNAMAGTEVTETYSYQTWCTEANGDTKPTWNTETAAATFTVGETTVNCYAMTNTVNGNSLGGRIASSNTKSGEVWFRYKSGKPANTGLFVLSGKTSYFSVLNLKEGDKLTITSASVVGGTIYSDNATYDVDGTATAVVSGTSVLSSGTTYTITADGSFNFYLEGYGQVSEIKIVTTVDQESVEAPVLTLTGANGGDRTVTCAYTDGNLGTTPTVYYTLDGTNPTTSSSTTTGTISVSASDADADGNVTVKAYSYISDDVYSDVTTLTLTGVGETLTLTTPSYYVSAMTAKGDYYNPVYNASVDNSAITGAPEATLTATFDGTEVSLPYTVTSDGTLIITASADGYTSSSVSVPVVANFTLKTETDDFGTINSSNIESLLGSGYTAATEPTRWSNWTKKAGYNLDGSANSEVDNGYYYYSITSGTTYYDLFTINGANVILAVGYGFMSSANGARSIVISSAEENSIAEFVVSYGRGSSSSEDVSEFVIASDNAITFSNVGAVGYPYVAQIKYYVPEAQTETMTIEIGDIKYCTFSDTEKSWKVPTEVTAYTATQGDGVVELTAIKEGIIPAGTGVVLGGTKGTYTLTATTDETTIGDNILQPSNTSLTGDGKYYVLGANDEGSAVFAPLNEGTAMKANKAYFVPTTSESEGDGAKLAIVIKGDATGISEVSSAVKSGKAYNLQGIEVGNNFKGLYIKDGKKVIK